MSAVLSGPALGLDTSMLPPPDPWRYLPLQRSQALLATSTDAHPHPVRVLFYGQSIIQQRWWRAVAGELRKSFPHARLEITNLAIAGFDAPRLLKAAEADIYPLRPDLIFFHCYGAFSPGGEWEALLRQIRNRTTADVILLGNHVTRNEDLHEPTRPDLIPPQSEAWLNYVMAPALADELGFCFPDNRTAWKAYLNAKQLPASALLSDAIHLTPDGSALQAAVLRPYLRTPRLVPHVDPFHNGRVLSRRVGTGDVGWTGPRLRMTFVGNRVDLVAAPGPAVSCLVRVDGAPPTSLPGGRGHGRTSSWQGDTPGRPALLRVGSVRTPVPEQWSLTITGVLPGSPPQFRFSVAGSVTGPDGSGVSTNRFVSNSGRVTIDPDDWYRKLPAGGDQLGAVLVWRSEDRALDTYRAQVVPGHAIEPVTTLVNDLPDGPHVLELIAESAETLPALATIRIYHPGGPLPGAEGTGTAVPTLRMLPLESGALTVWPAAAPGWHPSRIPSLAAPWLPATEATTNAYAFHGVRWWFDGPTGFFSLEHD